MLVPLSLGTFAIKKWRAGNSVPTSDVESEPRHDNQVRDHQLRPEEGYSALAATSAPTTPCGIGLNDVRFANSLTVRRRVWPKSSENRGAAPFP